MTSPSSSPPAPLRWTGSADYIASEDLQRIVNVAIALQRPLLLRGEPGTGKTLLARSIAEGLALPLLTWHVKSTTKAREGCYVYDAVQRLYDSRFQDKDVSDIRQYIKLGPLGQSFSADGRVVLLIDEVDKADVEFPNDLLHELDAMSFAIPETGDIVAAKTRPIVIISSNNEKELPDAFLRRVVFHYIDFPDEPLMAKIVDVHFPGLDRELLSRAMTLFYQLRSVEGLRKKPSTSELIDWIAALLAHGLDLSQSTEDLPFIGTLIKRERDLVVAKDARRPKKWR
ncbi:MAG: MoxR family ATPase [Deltaproteobacteria bacterium]|nr:MoxR family ATPase [Deltaproteobacteria bacterium]